MNLYHYLAITITRPNTLPSVHTGPGNIQPIVNVFLAIFGAAAVVVITYGGIKYVLSRGNPTEVAKAKDVILYAVIGLVITIIARSIISFVLNRTVF